MHNEISGNEKSSKKEKSLFAPLKYLALHREATIEEIAKQTGKNYSTILRATTLLVMNGSICLRLERTAPKGKELRHFALTFQGLVMYLSRKLNRTEIGEIAKAHEDMLLVFEKWDTFVKKNLENEMFLRLAEAVNFGLEHYIAGYGFAVPTLFRIGSQNYTGPGGPEIFDAIVLGFVFMDHPVEYVQERQSQQWSALEKIWIVVENDYVLRKRRDEFLSYLEREHKEGLKAIDEWRKYIILKIVGRRI